MPVARSTRFSCPPAKKPSDPPSGDQKGAKAPSVPATGCAVVVLSARSQSCAGFRSPAATNAMCEPSGESANDVAASVAGVVISVRTSGGGACRR